LPKNKCNLKDKKHRTRPLDSYAPRPTPSMPSIVKRNTRLSCSGLSQRAKCHKSRLPPRPQMKKRSLSTLNLPPKRSCRCLLTPGSTTLTPKSCFRRWTSDQQKDLQFYIKTTDIYNIYYFHLTLLIPCIPTSLTA
jgi:hypothetical protein